MEFKLNISDNEIKNVDRFASMLEISREEAILKIFSVGYVHSIEAVGELIKLSDDL